MVNRTIHLGKTPVGFAATSAESAAFIARTSGLDGTHLTAYDTLITGLVTDAVFANLDGLWILTAPDATTALLNLISSSFTATNHGATFTANQGFTGNGTSAYIDTGLSPNTATKFTQTNSAFGYYGLTSRTSGDGICQIGSYQGSYGSYILMFNPPSSTIQFDVNSSGFGGPIGSGENANGMWVAAREGTTNTVLYHNYTGGSLIADSSNVSTGFTNAFNFYLFADDNSGTASNFSSDQIAAAFVGGTLGPTKVQALSTRINTYMTTYGVNKY